MRALRNIYKENLGVRFSQSLLACVKERARISP